MVYSRATTSAMAERPAGFLVVLGAVFGVGILAAVVEKGTVSEECAMPMPMTRQGEGERLYLAVGHLPRVYRGWGGE